MRRFAMAFVTFFLLASAFAGASDDDSPVFAFVGLEDSEDAFTTAELRVFENRLTSELVSVARSEGFSVTIPENRQEILQRIIAAEEADPGTSLQRLVSAYAIVGGRLDRLAGRVYIDLRTVAVENESVLTAISAEFSDIQNALSEVEQIIAEAFASDLPVIAERDTVDLEVDDGIQENVELSDLVGDWHGDVGVTSVSINPDGTGVAVLNGRATMQLRISIDGSRVVARQDEPNAPKMYMANFPYTVAVQIVDIARPMQWEFTLSEDGTTLSGVKDTTFFQIDRGRVVWADNTYSREAVWTRSE